MDKPYLIDLAKSEIVKLLGPSCYSDPRGFTIPACLVKIIENDGKPVHVTFYPVSPQLVCD